MMKLKIGVFLVVCIIKINAKLDYLQTLLIKNFGSVLKKKGTKVVVTKVFRSNANLLINFVFSRKATKNDKIFTFDLTLCSKCQIYCEDFVNFCGLLRKHELY